MKTLRMKNDHPRFPRLIVAEKPDKVTIARVQDDVIITIQEGDETQYIKARAIGSAEEDNQAVDLWIMDLEEYQGK